ncbi:TonB-dependent receptor domain-containing protein [Sphingomonas abietis]|uniref:TonB-dependent receptor n=1 Tax=Sphingomonas abietis TaxID=3012344 RepID=A0ABY7NRA4_9SPHN|nr:TonB-dependent receptor [Sphingomonas abietis]WBO23717.1 TonB-dependent receptor [Sphingomonas abietis]
MTDLPISILSGQTINDQGYTNIGQALTNSPAFGVPGNSNVGSQGSFGAGQTFVNMYDLGAQRTLALVNGNRFVSSSTSSLFGAVQGSPVDLGQIAPGLVDRIDVVSVGGAPIYGSDAIAGTVNIILKKNYQGVELDGSQGISQKGDGQDYNFSFLAGKNFADGRGNITANVYYDHQSGLTTADRNITSSEGPFFGYNPAGNYQYQLYKTGGYKYSIFTNTGLPMVADSYPIISGQPYASVTNAAGQALNFNKSGHLTQFTDGIPLATGDSEVGGDGFPINDYGNLLTESKRIQGTLLANYELTDHIRFHGEFWASHDTAANLADQPYYSTADFGDPAGTANGNLILNTSNPYLSAADSATINAAVNAANGTNNASNDFYLARANTDLETGAFRSTTNLWRIVGGLDGDFTIGSRNFTWDATVNYGHVSTVTSERELVTQNFFNALDAVVGGNGQIQCASGYTNASIQTGSSTCAPLDIFGAGNESQSALNYVTALAKTHQVDTQFDAVADVKGSILTLPAGDVKIVLGYEHRRESQSFDPGAFYRGEEQSDGSYVQYGNSIPITPVAGSYNTNEGFGELAIPLVSPDMHVPLIHSLDLSGSARYTDNSLTGGFWSYTGGGTYSPVSGVTFRGNYTRSFRSPSVTELFSPTGSTFETANDPCDPRFISGGANPAQRAKNCAAEGIPTDFVSHVADATAEGSSGGNVNLQNEKADSWTAGGVLQPHFLPGFSLSADYISINIANEITEAGLTNEMDACYDSSDFPSNPYCSTFTRDANHQVTSYTDNFTNIAIEKFRALQAGIAYSFPLDRLGLPTGAGALDLSATYLHTFKHFTKTGEADQEEVLDNVSNPKDSVVANIDWKTNRFDWLWTVSYYGPTDVDPNNYDAYQYPRVSPYWMADTSVGIKTTNHFDIRLIVDNVFGLKVPFPYGSSYSENKDFDAIMGRYFRVNVKVKM